MGLGKGAPMRKAPRVCQRNPNKRDSKPPCDAIGCNGPWIALNRAGSRVGRGLTHLSGREER